MTSRNTKPVTAITIDFWNTLFDNANSAQRNAERGDLLAQQIADAGYSIPRDRIEHAYRGIWDYFDVQWLQHHRTPTSEEMIGEIIRGLDVQLPVESLERLIHTFENGILQHPPQLLPGALSAVEFLAGHARLALISDTAFSRGLQLRQLMERVGIAQYFTGFVFSDEIGVSKPHREAFETALRMLDASPEHAVHIGDIERTDIAGAHAAGMRSVLYRGDPMGHKYAEDTTVADQVMDSWDDIREVLMRLA